MAKGEIAPMEQFLPLLQYFQYLQVVLFSSVMKFVKNIVIVAYSRNAILGITNCLGIRIEDDVD